MMLSQRDVETGRLSGVERAAPGEVRVKRALLSVSDKDGIVAFAQGLRELGVELISTGGTARTLTQAGVDVRSIDDFTGFPEIMDGRVKTLHPRLYAGLLARRDDESHLAAAEEQGIEQVDLVCVNLYPFEQTVARGDADEEEVIENIDIGGPTMIRAAAKNHPFAAVVVDPADYESVLAELRDSDGRLALETRRRLAARAFACTARYDAAISRWFGERTSDGLPDRWASAYEKVADLRYGENPHQRGAFYAQAGAATHLLEGVEQLQGAVVQQPARPERRAGAGRGLRRSGVCDRQAQQPVRVRPRGDDYGGLREGLRVRSPERVRGRDRAQPAGRQGDRRAAGRAVHRGAPRPRLRLRRARPAQGEEERAAAAARRLAGPGAGARLKAGDRRAARAGS
jgi:hypothetical protein